MFRVELTSTLYLQLQSVPIEWARWENPVECLGHLFKAYKDENVKAQYSVRLMNQQHRWEGWLPINVVIH